MTRAQSRAIDLGGTGLCACFNFRKTARAITQLYDAALRPSGIRSTQFAVLVALAKVAPVSVGDLASLLITDASTMTRNLRVMRRQGLLHISRRASRRQRLVTLTRRGEGALAASLPMWREVQRDFIGKIGVPQWTMLQRELERFSALAVADR